MTIEDLHLRSVAASLSGLIYWTGVIIQARRIRRKIGRSPNVKPRGSKEQALWLGWFVVVLAWLGQPAFVDLTGAKPGLSPMLWLISPLSLVAGLGLLSLGYAGTLWAYAAMGNTWRMGINPGEKTMLIDRGPYRWVRHPIYALQIVMLAGTALLLPTAISFGILALHCLCVLIKVRDEEEYLSRVHGEAYRNYRLHVGGVFPNWNRSRVAAAHPASPAALEIRSPGKGS